MAWGEPSAGYFEAIGFGAEYDGRKEKQVRASGRLSGCWCRVAFWQHEFAVPWAAITLDSQQAARLNAPVLLRPSNREPGTASWFKTDRPALVIDTVKPAEGGNGLILRLYEAYGTRGRATLSSSLTFSRAALCTGLENALSPLEWKDGAVTLPYRPFELMTVRLS